MNQSCLVMPYETHLFRSVFFATEGNDRGNTWSNAALDPYWDIQRLKFFLLKSATTTKRITING
jgi:hypothetical protein